MARKFWWPGSKPEQLVLVKNFQVKLPGHSAALGLTPAQITAADDLCNAFIGSVESTDQCKMSMQAMTQWRDQVLYGEPGDPAPAAPVFNVVGPVTYTLGVVTQFFALRDLIVASPGYTEAIGEDLGIVGAEKGNSLSPETTQPVFKSVTVNGNTVNVSGSMQGFDAMRVEYAPKNGDYRTVAFLTNTPGGFQVTTTTPNQPENGHIRAVYIKKNAEFGTFSADYPITLS
ncbi:MAG: hypothetical protein AB7J13_12485 [Pyrinomonadaceae bacterium]